MATGKAVSTFEIPDASGGCNYSDDLTSLTKSQSPDSLNVEFFNGRIRKRMGEMAFTTPTAGQGGIDAYTKLMLHMDGSNGSTTFTDSELTPKTVTAHGNVVISTAQSKFGGASGIFQGGGIDSNTVLMLHMDDVGLTDSSASANVVTLNGTAARSAVQSKFGGFSALFNGGALTDYLSVADSEAWNFGAGDFTIDFWIRLNSTPSTNMELYSQYVDDNNNHRMAIKNVGAGNFIFFTSVEGAVTTGDYSTAEGICPNLNQWYHIALVRSGSSMFLFIDGVNQTFTAATVVGTLPSLAAAFEIGRVGSGTQYFDGYLDEYRVSKGSARWTANFTPPVAAYTSADYLTVPHSANFDLGASNWTLDFWFRTSNVSQITSSGEMIFCQGTDANNYMRISLTGTNTRLQITEVVAGVTTFNILSHDLGLHNDTWYHLAVVRKGTASTDWVIFINGVIKASTVAVNSTSFTNMAGSLFIGASELSQTQPLFGYLDEFRFSAGIARWTSGFTVASVAYDTYTAGSSVVGYSLVDFSDTSSNHRQVAHFGNTVYAFDRVTSSNVTLRSGAPLTRSFNAKAAAYLIQSYNNYSAPYYWDGAASSMLTLSEHAPGAKRWIEFQGYLLGMNTSANKTRCYYQLISNILGSGAAYSDFFTLTPAPNDDEITDPFILNGRLYAGTNYSIFRISFVGGVTVFEFKQVVSSVGVVPGTAQIIITEQFGQVVLFLGTDKRMYMFDGANVKNISDLYYYHNDSTPIAMDLIDDNYKQNSFAVYDTTQRIYRLWVTKQAQSINFYCLNIDVDTFAYYPFDNMEFSAGAMCYDAFLRPYLVCTDYLGKLHKMFVDTPTDNGDEINEYYTSPLVSSKDTTTKKGENIIVHMTPCSDANLLVYDKVDYRRAWEQKQALPLGAPRDKFLGHSFVLGSSVLGSEKDIVQAQIAIRSEFNTYQFKLACDTPTAAPWEILQMSVNQAALKFGRAEAQR